MNLDEVKAEFDRWSRLIDAANEELVTQGKAWAEAERDYRKAKAEAWARCPNDPPGTKAGERDWTAERRKEWVNAQTADKGYRRNMADCLRWAAWQSCESRQSQVSALQTLVNAHMEEAKFARTGPEMSP